MNSTQLGVEALVLSITERLRAVGVPISTSETLDAVTAMSLIDLSNRRELKIALSTTLIKDASFNTAFHRAFNSVFWPGS